ncbi:NapC/NirT family cytochrome c [Shigella flexneri]
MRNSGTALRRPSARWSVLALVAIGSRLALRLLYCHTLGSSCTSTTEFCVSCHSMSRMVAQTVRAFPRRLRRAS